jgi:hypothetical protein
MADNVEITPGAGKTIGADEIDAILYQRIKLIFGADGVNEGDVSFQNGLPVNAVGELIEAVEAMRQAIQSLNRTMGLAQVNPLTGSMFVDGSRVTQPISGNISTVSQVSLVANMSQLGGQNANSFVPSFERNTADNLRRNIIVT